MIWALFLTQNFIQNKVLFWVNNALDAPAHFKQLQLCLTASIGTPGWTPFANSLEGLWALVACCMNVVVDVGQSCYKVATGERSYEPLKSSSDFYDPVLEREGPRLLSMSQQCGFC